MPFRIDWTNEARNDFLNLSPRDQVFVRMVVGSFRHDRWLEGRPHGQLANKEAELRELQYEHVRRVYELDRHNETVTIRQVV